MAYTTYSASQAVQRANAETSWAVGMCLNFVWHCIAEPHSYGLPDANSAWDAATQKVTTGTPPPGAPVYFRGFAHGHIALSLGGGRIRSTDWPTKGRVGTTTIGDLCRDWYGSQANYLGWSRDFAGDPIRGLEETSTNYSPPPVIPQEDIPMAIADDILAELRAFRTEEKDRYTVYTGRYQDEQGDLGRIEATATNHRTEDAARYTDFVSRFNAVLDAEKSDSTKLDELKTLVAALPKA